VLARYADAAGIDRIGVDLERLGKADRQRALGTWISPHTEQDLARVGSALDRAQLFVRVNPYHAGSKREIESVLDRGTRVLMLPMALDPRDVQRFVELVGARAHVVLLVEHVEALRRLDELLAVTGVGEVHIGLNDLALSLGLRNRWLALAGDLVAAAGRRVRAAGLRFGVGGIGRVGDDSLPVPADLVYAEYARTGATAALVSRSFFEPVMDGPGLAAEIARARARFAAWYGSSAASVEAAHAELVRRADCASGW
jgi:HpcH/HpaI aldolase/citrate lyase family